MAGNGPTMNRRQDLERAVIPPSGICPPKGNKRSGQDFAVALSPKLVWSKHFRHTTADKELAARGRANGRVPASGQDRPRAGTAGPPVGTVPTEFQAEFWRIPLRRRAPHSSRGAAAARVRESSP